MEGLIVRHSTSALYAVCLAIVGAFALPQSALATPVTWTVGGAFADGGTVSGSLTYDAATNAMSAWSLTVDGGNTGTFPTFTYSSAISGSFTDLAGTDDKFIFCDTVNCLNGASGRRDLRLAFAAPLTDAGGVAALLAGPVGPNPQWGFECFNCSPVRLIVSGSAEAAPTAVPEPGTVLLLTSGLATIAARRRRNRR